AALQEKPGHAGAAAHCRSAPAGRHRARDAHAEDPRLLPARQPQRPADPRHRGDDAAGAEAAAAPVAAGTPGPGRPRARRLALRAGRAAAAGRA
nr:hypothetical protein [Tanacetum cinerariifolium]